MQAEGTGYPPLDVHPAVCQSPVRHLETSMPRMTVGIRKLALTAHVTSSVAWMGGVACFLVLSIAGFTSQQPQTIQAAYLAMNLICWFVVVPLSFASPV